jgi:hypothetical protein
MTRAPYITTDTRRRRLYLLRTNHLTLIKLSMWQKLMTPTKYREFQPTAGKTGAALKSMRPAKLASQLRAKTHALRKSP